MEIFYSDEFKKQLKKTLERSLEERVRKAIEKIIDCPTVGKPLRYELAGKRSLRVPPFRIIYGYEEGTDRLILYYFGHRKDVYG